jgi:hypothetical protein
MGQEARSLREGMDALTWGVYKCSVTASCRRKSDSNSFALNGLIITKLASSAPRVDRIH